MRNTLLQLDSRTARGTLVPWCGASNKAPVLIFRDDKAVERVRRTVLFAALFGSFVFDFVVRQKLSSASLNRFILIQVCAPSPSVFDSRLRIDGRIDTAANWILMNTPAVFCNTSSMLTFFRHIGVTAAVPWNRQLRHNAISLIDSIVARMYGVTREDYRYILERFPILRSQEIEKYGEYRSLRLALEFWDKCELVTRKDAHPPLVHAQ
jgi:hypothetical protein